MGWPASPADGLDEMAASAHDARFTTDSTIAAPFSAHISVQGPNVAPPGDQEVQMTARKLRIGILDLLTRNPTRALYARIMNANLASIMPQAVAAWCEQEGHDVTFTTYTGHEDLAAEMPPDVDVVFIGGFTQSAQLAYALSNLYRSRGAVTVLGGPHARCYPEDARQYFDYVLGYTDLDTIREVLGDLSPHRPRGLNLSAAGQPRALPSVRERWKFIELTLRKAPVLNIVPMLGSLGCPYSCSFCIDAAVPYQPLDFGVLKDDLRFLLTKFRRPRVAWHDPNFGVRFDDYMEAIEEAVPPGSIDFLAESSLSLLTEPHLKRLKRNGFQAMLPGIESWYDMGDKSKTGRRTGMEKVRTVSDHVNMILRYVPYVQTNFVLGLDADEGPEPFELTKRFVSMTPGAFPGYSLLTAFGRAAPVNREYQQADRVLPFPFHFLNNNQAMNVRPLNYSWPEFYTRVADLTAYTFSWRAVVNRYRAGSSAIPRWMNVVRAVSSEGSGRVRYHRDVLRRLGSDAQFRSYFERETTTLPPFYVNQVRNDLGPLWSWLPRGALEHEPNTLRQPPAAN
jgi:hypothetical protein